MTTAAAHDRNHRGCKRLLRADTYLQIRLGPTQDGVASQASDHPETICSGSPSQLGKSC